MKSRGSSPHTRGAPAPGFSIRPGAGIIPAYAGSTFPSLASTSARRDHPRIRGEHSKFPGGFFHLVGSSPHTRGARDGVAAPRAPAGIIPAYAGSTGTLRLSYIQFRDHPRIRGEHPALTRTACRNLGSSPHTRGAHGRSGSSRIGVRIIPAYAGSTPANVRRYDPGQDHPRIRGEHGVRVRTGARCGGSSPHTRGALGEAAGDLQAGRIIPAYAGSTKTFSTTLSLTRDHPRIRGEHFLYCTHVRTSKGSSPHTRGARALSRGL